MGDISNPKIRILFPDSIQGHLATVGGHEAQHGLSILISYRSTWLGAPALERVSSLGEAVLRECFGMIVEE